MIAVVGGWGCHLQDVTIRESSLDGIVLRGDRDTALS